jgi:hypothetical protein
MRLRGLIVPLELESASRNTVPVGLCSEFRRTFVITNTLKGRRLSRLQGQEVDVIADLVDCDGESALEVTHFRIVEDDTFLFDAIEGRDARRWAAEGGLW